MKKSLYRERKAEAFREMLKAKEKAVEVEEVVEVIEKPKKVSKRNANNNK